MRLARVELQGGLPGPGWAWWCPGCCTHHAVDEARWSVTGAESSRPSIVPSVVVRDAAGAVVCHSYVREGSIEFLSDCRHPLAGATRPLEPLDLGPA